MSAVAKTESVARVGSATPVGKTQWVERRANRLAVAYGLSAQDARTEAENDYAEFHGRLCDPVSPVTMANPVTPVTQPPSNDRQARAPRSCDALGLCQSRTPRCSSCQPMDGAAQFDFPNDRQIGIWMKWMLICAAGTAAVAAVLFVLGYLP